MAATPEHIHYIVSYVSWRADGKKVVEALNRRLHELTGFVAYDQINRYEIDMPKGWKQWRDAKQND
jgi:hypothetical protein